MEILFQDPYTPTEDLVKLSIHKDGIAITVPVAVFSKDNPVLETTFTGVVPAEDLGSYLNIRYNQVRKWVNQFPHGDAFYQMLVKRSRVLAQINELDTTPIAIKDTYVCGQEFIPVDADTDFHGNFEQNGVQGVHLDARYERKDPPGLDFKIELNRTDFPYDYWNQINWDSSSDHKRRVFNSMSLALRVDTLRNKVQTTVSDLECNYFPYSVRLQGTDDDSWTKYFATEQEMLNEIQYLRAVAPINKHVDVQSRGYVFTN